MYAVKNICKIISRSYEVLCFPPYEILWRHMKYANKNQETIVRYQKPTMFIIWRTLNWCYPNRFKHIQLNSSESYLKIILNYGEGCEHTLENQDPKKYLKHIIFLVVTYTLKSFHR